MLTFLSGLLRPSREGALCLHPIKRAPGVFMSDTSSVPRALLVFCINQEISASSSLSLSYRQLRTTRFWSIKGPQQLVKPIVLPSLWPSSVFVFFFSSTNIPCLYISPKSTSALLIEEEKTIGSFIPFFILGTVFL